MDKTSRILITGASGLIGSALVRLLKSEGYENVLTPTHDEVDCRLPEDVDDYFLKEHPEYVFHLAAHVGGIQENNNNPAQFIYNNTVMQCTIFNACGYMNVKKLLFPGSACAYPRDADHPIKESAFLTGAPEPTNIAYALAKQNGIVMAQSYAKQYGMRVVLPMVANTYGIGDKSSHVIPDMIKKMKKDEPMSPLWGSGFQRREFIYADDVASAFLFLMKNYDSDEIINVGTMEEIRIMNLADKIAYLVRTRWLPKFDHSMAEGAPRKCLDSSKLYAMGWSPTISIDEGLKRVIAS